MGAGDRSDADAAERLGRELAGERGGAGVVILTRDEARLVNSAIAEAIALLDPETGINARGLPYGKRQAVESARYRLSLAAPVLARITR